MKDELFFVGIQDPVELRKDLLTSSKSIIDSLRRYERYRLLKEDKLSRILELKLVFDELIVLNKKLRGKLPKAPIKMPTIEEKPTVQTKQQPKQALKTTRNKLDILEEELSKVEERLKGLE